ncbi:triose-phosphate isomerase [Staphylospora marina]|uniref:triose-phosphate isomerase n=1 Tax=Staphylospora marina TaxID=2490858 RepID=UPI000F5BB60C|nr:triose-phosphate isomerase [Staphylospora marina]
MRTPVIAGNWKMYKTPEEAEAFAAALHDTRLPDGVEAVICAPFVALPALRKALEGTGVGLGAQNVHWEREGAFTGEISVPMLRAIGVKYAIIGHSERRAYFAETDETVHRKLKAALAGGLVPIVCVGETLEEREQGRTKEVVRQQVEKALQGISAEDAARVIIAYEPVWAIGTGRAATAQDAEEVIAFIRDTVASLTDASTAAAVRIQYGGSVKPDNIRELLDMPNIDGALVGGASLDPASFIKLVQAAEAGDDR